jgi:hypothetical protein
MTKRLFVIALILCTPIPLGSADFPLTNPEAFSPFTLKNCKNTQEKFEKIEHFTTEISTIIGKFKQEYNTSKAARGKVFSLQVNLANIASLCTECDKAFNQTYMESLEEEKSSQTFQLIRAIVEQRADQTFDLALYVVTQLSNIITEHDQPNHYFVNAMESGLLFNNTNLQTLENTGIVDKGTFADITNENNFEKFVRQFKIFKQDIRKKLHIIATEPKEAYDIEQREAIIKIIKIIRGIEKRYYKMKTMLFSPNLKYYSIDHFNNLVKNLPKTTQLIGELWGDYDEKTREQDMLDFNEIKKRLPPTSHVTIDF